MPADFYDPDNTAGLAARTMACDAALQDLLVYMQQEGVRVAAFDATNSTKERRRHIWKVLKDSALGAKFMFVESICDQDDVRFTKRTNALVHFVLVVLLFLTFCTPPSIHDAWSLTDLGRKHSQGQTVHAGLPGHGP
jgi:hypothetical protein